MRKLIESQFPHWAHLPLSPVPVPGWDNHTFRLGSDLVVRLPSAACYAGQVETEGTWLPRLAPHLPMPIPVPVAVGHPSDVVPWGWTINRWLEGETASTAGVENLKDLAEDLARFLRAFSTDRCVSGTRAGTSQLLSRRSTRGL